MANLVDPNEMMFTSFQPKVSNRYVLYLDGVPSFLIKKAARPSVKFNTITMDHMNTQRKLQGKATWDDITLSLYDPIVPSGAQAVMEWIRLGYESVTGRSGYSDFYKKEIVINVLGPVGDKVEEWTLKGAFPTSAGFGELDWSSDTPMEISVGIAYDYAILQY